MLATALEHAADFFRSDQRPRRIVDRDEIGICADMVETDANGILPLDTAGHNLSHLCLCSEQLAQLAQTIAASDQNDLVDTVRALERINGVRDQRLAAKRGKQFVEPHALARTGGDDDGA